jgi:GR25 family glycosyltransferase involved in LPS biosynthesis
MLPVFYINLASRLDRREFMERQFLELGLKADRVGAISVADLTEAQLDRYCSPARRWSIAAARYACNLSHMKAWEALIASGARRALILEDDAVLSSALPAFLEALDASDDGSDIVRIEKFKGRWLYFGEAEQRIDGVGLRRCFSHDIGAAGYVITASFASRLLGEPIMHKRLVDDVLFLPFSRIGRSIKVRYTDPALCSQLTDAALPEAKSDLSTPADALHRVARRRHPLIKFSFQLERWFLEDIPQGPLEACVRFIRRPTLVDLPLSPQQFGWRETAQPARKVETVSPAILNKHLEL